MNQTVLAAQIRETKGKRAAGELRRNNQIPAIFYGPDIETTMLTMNYPDFERIVKQDGGENMVLDLQIQSDKGTENKKVMIKDMMVDPVSDKILHADFYEISMDKEIKVSIPINLVNTPVGVTNGGILQYIRREIAITCLPGDLINSLDVDVSGLDIGDSVHVRDVNLPEGITPVDEGHLTIAVLTSPAIAAEEEEEEEEIGVGEEEIKTEIEGSEEPSDEQ